MRYAILKDSYPRYAPNPLSINGMTVANPTEEMLLSAGYLPVVTEPAPETDAQHYPESRWEEWPNEIHQVWEIKPIPQEPEGPTLESLDHRLTDVEYIITGEVVSNAQ